MSGRKYISVENSELESLRRDASQLRALRQDLPDRIEAVIRQNEQTLNNRIMPLETRQQEYIRAIADLDIGIRQVEQNMANSIAEQAIQTREALRISHQHMDQQRRKLRKTLHDTAQRLEQADRETEERLRNEIKATEILMQRLNNDTRKEMNQQEQRLSEKINQERQTRQQQVQLLQGQIDSIHTDSQRIASMAQSWLQGAKTLRDFINGNYRHDHFAPRKLQGLENTLAIAQRNNDDNAPQAALANAQIVFQDLSNLRLDLERLETEWHIWHEQVIFNAENLLAEAQANRKVQSIEQSLETSEVNYWTNGMLTKLEEEIKLTLQKAKDEIKPLKIDELRQLVEEKLPEFDHRLDDILEKAQLEIIRSQIRANIADLAMQALHDQGYTSQEGTYEGEDFRAGFIEKAVNREGSEVVISVVTDSEGKNRMEINSFDENIPRSQNELLTRSQEIANSMREHSIDVGDMKVSDPQILSEVPDDADRDIDIVRQRNPHFVAQSQIAAKK